MTGTGDLRTEHRAVARMLDIMDEIAASTRRGEPQNADDVSEIIEFLRVFVDKCHHAKEERLLFPAMRAAGASGAEETLGSLFADHAHGREAVTRMASMVPRLDADEFTSRALAEAIDGYTQLLRAHIVREERDCFDVADRELPATVQEQLNDGYDRIEVEVVGGGVHERFHALLDRLSQAYLG